MSKCNLPGTNSSPFVSSRGRKTRFLVGFSLFSEAKQLTIYSTLFKASWFPTYPLWGTGVKLPLLPPCIHWIAGRNLPTPHMLQGDEAIPNRIVHSPWLHDPVLTVQKVQMPVPTRGSVFRLQDLEQNESPLATGILGRGEDFFGNMFLAHFEWCPFCANWPPTCYPRLRKITSQHADFVPKKLLWRSFKNFIMPTIAVARLSDPSE